MISLVERMVFEKCNNKSNETFAFSAITRVGKSKFKNVIVRRR